MNPVFCRGCRKPIDPADAFCRSCGADQCLSGPQPTLSLSPISTATSPTRKVGVNVLIFVTLAVLVVVISIFGRLEVKARDQHENEQKLAGEYLLLRDQVVRDEARLKDLRFLDATTNLHDPALLETESRVARSKSRMQEIASTLGLDKVQSMIHLSH